jgi:hypothetical protein
VMSNVFGGLGFGGIFVSPVFRLMKLIQSSLATL